MDSHTDYVRDYVDQVLKTGLTLTDLLTDLLDALPEDSFAGENSAAVLVEMLTGTLRPVAEAAGERTVRDATALLAASLDRTMADMRAAIDLASDS